MNDISGVREALLLLRCEWYFFEYLIKLYSHSDWSYTIWLDEPIRRGTLGFQLFCTSHWWSYDGLVLVWQKPTWTTFRNLWNIWAFWINLKIKTLVIMSKSICVVLLRSPLLKKCLCSVIIYIMSCHSRQSSMLSSFSSRNLSGIFYNKSNHEQKSSWT